MMMMMTTLSTQMPQYAQYPYANAPYLAPAMQEPVSLEGFTYGDGGSSSGGSTDATGGMDTSAYASTSMMDASASVSSMTSSNGAMGTSGAATMFPGVPGGIQALIQAASPHATLDPAGSTQQLGLASPMMGAQAVGTMNMNAMGLGSVGAGLAMGSGTPTNIVNMVTSTLLSSYAQDPVNGKKLLEKIVNDPAYTNNPNFQAAYQQIQALEAAHMQGGMQAPAPSGPAAESSQA
jgi:hypothetical protein